MTDRQIAIRLAVIDGGKAKAELRAVGEDGERALRRIGDATTAANTKLRLVNAVTQEARGHLDAMASNAGLAGAALGGLGSAGLVAAAGLGAVSLALTAGLRESAEAEKVQARLEGVLKATGFAAGLTGQEISNLADEIEGYSLASAESVKEAAGILATFRSVSGDTFTRAIRLAQDLSAVFGQSLASSATQLGKALEDPEQGLTALRRVGVSFTDTQKEMIVGMMKLGDVAGAQRAILDALEQQVGGAGRAEGSGLAGAFFRASDAVGDLLKKFVLVTGTHDAVRFALDNIAKGAQRLTGALDAADLGRQVVEANRQLLEAQKQLDDARATARQTGLDVDRALAESWQREVDRLSGRVDSLIAQGRAEVEAVDTARAGAQAAQDERRRDTLKGIVAEIDKAGQAYDSLPEKIARARAEEEHRRETIRATLLPDGSNRAEIDAALAASRDLEQQRIAALEKSASKTDEAREAERRRKEILREVKKVTEEIWTPAEKYAATIEKLNGLLASGAIDQETYARAVSHAREEMEKGEKAALAKATDAASGVRRAINNYMEDVSNAAKVAEQATRSALGHIEDALVTMVTTGKFQWKSLVDSIVADLVRLQIRQLLGGLTSGLSGGGGLFAGLFGGVGSTSGPVAAASQMFGSPIYHGGGLVGAGGASRMVPALAFAGAPRLHDGAYLKPDEVPAILQRGERVLSRREAADYQRGREVPVVLTFNVTTPDASSFRRAQSQITAEMAAAIERARRNL
ncbi:phage tail tape measure C-terminal domain-containing protein [Blastochloris viridis]|uniref:Phage tail length tape-measure protein 1 n=1 Tax=Blastochloris viridis TaxID=1079 RepID=A0A0H5BFZ7_BLAVI|nr:phage tail tape measure C-terminal domain-containing protein [Blastochloris viridis]ALK08999.1 Lambda phage tail tape-measure protein (Tape_meas_lam_C) [Blastochloris viridis]BAS01141.1 phage tail length tape-measure protein 1 [Blastochloris viridis]CUU41660.1 Phage-related minor tail protein [Blastochloris viridis]